MNPRWRGRSADFDLVFVSTGRHGGVVAVTNPGRVEEVIIVTVVGMYEHSTAQSLD